MRRIPPLNGLILALAFGLFGRFAVLALHQREMAVDDAYITYRYAAAVAGGHGLRWNLGEAPSEGFSSPLHVLAIACFVKGGAGPVSAALVLNLVSVAGLLCLLLLAAKPSSWYFPLTALPALWLLVDPSLLTHATRGLETPLFAFLSVAVVGLCARAVGSPPAARPRGFVVLGVASFILLLARPEAPLVVAACWVVAAGVTWKLRRPAGELRAGVTLLGVLVAVLLAWKLWYFGSILPLPYWTKADVPGLQGLAETKSLLMEYRFLLLPWVVSALAALWGAWGQDSDHTGSLATLTATLAAVVPWLAYSMKILHEMGFAHRFAYPAVTLATLGLIAGIELGLSRAPLAGLGAWRWARSSIWAPLVLLSLLAWPRVGKGLPSLSASRPRDPYVAAFTRFGTAIADQKLGERLTLVCGFAGAAPYAAGVRHVDPLGLVSDRFSRRHGRADRVARLRDLRYDVASWPFPPASTGAETLEGDPLRHDPYVFGWLLPQAGLMSRFDVLPPGSSWAEVVFAQMCALRDSASLVGELDLPRPGWRSFVYVSRSSPYHDLLVRALRQRIDLPVSGGTVEGSP